MSGERWLFVGEDGDVWLHTELDGYCAKKGLKPQERPATISEIQDYFMTRSRQEMYELLVKVVDKNRAIKAKGKK